MMMVYTRKKLIRSTDDCLIGTGLRVGIDRF